MSKTIEAIFEDGVLKPVSPLAFSEHARVTLVIEETSPVTSDLLSLASTVYNDLSTADISDIEKIALDRSLFSRD
jgi:predicted DNA-binding antitoxin AbrB/MazE fold protein